MSGYQFIHVETYARKANAAGNCVAQIFGEVRRDPVYSLHVGNPTFPARMGGPRGDGGFSLEQLEAMHQSMIETAATPVTMQNGTTTRRSIRHDRHTLLAAVASYPLPTIEALTDENRPDFEHWLKLNLRFARKIWGAQFKGWVLHTDEAYPHLHIFSLPDARPDVDARMLVAGMPAKREREAAVLAATGNKKLAVKASNRTYKAIMREFQTDYFHAVGEPCGLLRDGPRRRRLTRSEWVREMEAAQRKAPSRLDAALTEMDRQHEVQLARSEALETKEKWVSDREHAIAQADRDQSALRTLCGALKDAISGDIPVAALEELEEVKAASEDIRALAQRMATQLAEIQKARSQAEMNLKDTETRLVSIGAEEERLQRAGQAHEKRVFALDAGLEAAEKIIGAIEGEEAAPALDPPLCLALPRLEPLLKATSATVRRTRADAAAATERLATADRTAENQQILLDRMKRDAEAAAADRRAAEIERREQQGLRETLSPLIGRLVTWLRRGDLPLPLRAEARSMALELDPDRNDLPAVSIADLQPMSRHARTLDEPEGHRP